MTLFELRVWNYVNFDGKVDRITSVGKYVDGINHGIWSFERLSPIPLTDNIIEKFGGKYPLLKEGVFQAFNGKKGTNKLWILNKDLYGYFLSLFENKNEPIIRVDTVHELQNAIYIITGKDIDLEL